MKLVSTGPSSSKPVAIVNGRVMDGNSAFVALGDRGFAYGDGAFETVRCVQGTLPLLEGHLARLKNACDVLRIDISFDSLRQSLSQLLHVLNNAPRNNSSGVVKIIVTRGEGGRGCYLPKTCSPNIICSFTYRDLGVGRSIELVQSAYSLPASPGLAGIKHMSRMEYVCAELSLNKPLLDGQELLMLDVTGAVVETMHHNIFLWDGNTCKTPDLKRVGVEGVMRRTILSILSKLNIDSCETTLFPGDIVTAKEVFITNAVQGPESVQLFNNQSYKHSNLCKTLSQTLQKQYSFYEG